METAPSGGATDAIEDAESAEEELRDALEGAGILLPSLGLDTVTCHCEYLPPLVDLGRCTPGVARRLAAALRAGAAEEEA